METCYLSFDIEADGDSPSVSNMLSIGVYGLTKNKTEVCRFQRNLKPLPDKKASTRCMTEFWDKNPDAWKFVNSDQQDPVKAMKELADLLTELKTKYRLVWVAAPAAYDWQWLKAYYEQMRLVYPETPDIGFRAFCVSTLLASYCKRKNLDSGKTWKELAERDVLTHDPLDDAIVQGTLFVNLCNLENIEF